MSERAPAAANAVHDWLLPLKRYAGGAAEPIVVGILGLAAAVLLWFLFDESLLRMVGAWEQEEYSYGYILPLVILFFLWQRSDALARIGFRRSWLGFGVVLLGVVMNVAGDLATLWAVKQYAFIVTVWGLFLCVMGWPAFRKIAPALVLLLFLVPLPNFIYNNLSAQLQLISSELGVAVIRLFGVPVFLEGNVIDLGTYKLQVVEACSGLRYLFPLAALGYIAAYVFKGAWWKKAVIFLSTIPITVLMNSFRIGVTGVLVDWGGIEMAEGFLHDFEGWVVFMACAGILVLEMWALARIGPRPMALRDAFSIEGPARVPQSERVPKQWLSAPLIASVALLAVAAVAAAAMPEREERIPDRVDFLFFPSGVAEWTGRTQRLESIYVDALKLDDYYLADFSRNAGDTVNLYIAYYESQRKGASVHSPKTCLPGGGWRLEQFGQREIPGAQPGGEALRVNRALIQMGDERQLVYYWFQQRGRLMTNEYLVKWFLFWDALMRNRTDGALVRLTAPVPPGEDLAAADAALSDFAVSLSQLLPRFIPE